MSRGKMRYGVNENKNLLMQMADTKISCNILHIGAYVSQKWTNAISYSICNSSFPKVLTVRTICLSPALSLLPAPLQPASTYTHSSCN